MDIKPSTNTAVGNASVNTHQVKDSTNVVTDINITTDTLFLVLLFILFICILVIYSYNKFHLHLHGRAISELQQHPALRRSEPGRREESRPETGESEL